MNSLENLIKTHFILNNADIFIPYFFKYCNLIYGREYPYSTDNIRKMLECIFNDAKFNAHNMYLLQNKTDNCYISFISNNEIAYKLHLIRYLDEILCQ